MNINFLIILTIIIPLAGIPLILLSRNSPNLREFITILTASILFLTNLLLTINTLEHSESKTFVIVNFFPGGSIQLTPEPLGLIFGLIASGLWIVTSIYSIGYMRGKNEKNQTRFYCFFALAIAATMGVAYAGNLITLFIFYEALSLSTYPLVTHHQSENAKQRNR